MTQDEIQAVALRERLRRAFDADSVAEKNLAIRAAYDFITALDAARGKAEPVAWMYTHGDGIVGCNTTRYEPAVLNALGYTETPLYAHPPADRVARVVEWLRNGGGTDISQLSGSTQMLFIKGMNLHADAIERGEPFNG